MGDSNSTRHSVDNVGYTVYAHSWSRQTKTMDISNIYHIKLVRLNTCCTVRFFDPSNHIPWLMYCAIGQMSPSKIPHKHDVQKGVYLRHSLECQPTMIKVVWFIRCMIAQVGLNSFRGKSWPNRLDFLFAVYSVHNFNTFCFYKTFATDCSFEVAGIWRMSHVLVETNSERS